MKSDIEKINKILSDFIEDKVKKDCCLYDEIKYSVLIGGKRLRPLIMYNLYKDLIGNVESESLNKVIIAMEFLHTYSLVHDDLPAMDNDIYRRGNLTTHAKYGEARAILVGDLLLTYSFELISKIDLDIINEFSIASKRLIFGQVDDMFNVLDEKDKILKMYSNKTGALIELAFKVVLRLVSLKTELSKSLIEDLVDISKKIGVVYQIQDDLLDIFGDFELVGKSVNSDDGKYNLPRICGVDYAKVYIENEKQNIIDKLNKYNLYNTLNIIEYLFDRNK